MGKFLVRFAHGWIFLYTLAYLRILGWLSPIYCAPQGENKRSNNANHTLHTFSGVYLPYTKYNAEHYAGAWLTTKSRFLSCIDVMKKAVSLEDATFAILYQGVNVMTRDYFDFQVVHLSSTTNQMPTLMNDQLNAEIVHRLTETVSYLAKGKMPGFYRWKKDTRINEQTVVVIPFATTPASLHFYQGEEKAKQFSSSVRIFFLQSTILSVYRYFPKIVVSVRSDDDMRLVQGLGLPIWKYFNLAGIFKEREQLPKYSMLHLYLKLSGKTEKSSNQSEAEEWAKIKYIYYTEADQILHARHLIMLYNLLDRFNTTLTIAPHRLQVRFRLLASHDDSTFVDYDFT
jgi:hypothetical protein